MAVFESTERLERPATWVYAWHRRPGALTRLSPEWAQTVVEEAYPPLSSGAQARLKTSVPGTAGTIRVPFVSEHHAGPTPLSFVDRMISGPLSSWEHTHTFADVAQNGTEHTAGQACVIHDRIEYEVLPTALRSWGRAGGAVAGAFTQKAMESTVAKTFADRTKRLRADILFQDHALDRCGPQQLKVLVAGASGLVGSQVAALLSTAGHEVRTLVRGQATRADQISWDPAAGELDSTAVAWADVVIHLGGASIGTRFTESHKQKILRSRIDSTRLLVDTCASLTASDRPQALICASAVGAYGADRGDAVLTESSALGEGFLADVCRQWERTAAGVEELGMRWVSLRTGVVLSSLGGVVKLQIPLYLSGLGGPLGKGQQWFSWVSLDDVASAYMWAALDESLSGPVNAVAPEPVRYKEFSTEFGKALRRPAVVPVPTIGPRILLGREGAQQLALANQRAVPDALEAAHFPFRHRTVADVLAWTLPPR